MKVIITENRGSTIVGVIDNWAGPVPRQGDFLEHPPLGVPLGRPNVMSVKCVTYHMLTCPAEGGKHLVAHPEPHIEISV